MNDILFIFLIKFIHLRVLYVVLDGYYVAYEPITLPCILLMFIEIKFIYWHSCMMFEMKSMSIYNDYVNYDEIIIYWSLVFKNML